MRRTVIGHAVKIAIRIDDLIKRPGNDPAAFRDPIVWLPKGRVTRIACRVAARSMGALVSSKVIGGSLAVAHRPIQRTVLSLRRGGTKLPDRARCIPSQIPVVVGPRVDEDVVRRGRCSPSAGQMGVGVRTRKVHAVVAANADDRRQTSELPSVAAIPLPELEL